MTKFEEEFEKFKLTAGASPKHKKIINHFKDWQAPQALPVVPEFVAEFIESYKDRRTIYGVFDKISKNRKIYPKLYEWVFENENSQATFALAFITGKYQVEKPQLFYLKNNFTNSYLCQYPSDKSFYHLSVDDDRASKLVTKFTQAEIDSMETGSYELVPVEDGE